MKIRKTRHEDLLRVLDIYEKARQYMRASGNPTQWAGGYPPEERIRQDISQGISYVVCDGDNPVGVFVFFKGVDPTYIKIDGQWLNDKPYGVMHRIASDGSQKGIFGKMADFCKSQVSELRIDTHKDNLTMQHLLDKHGFVKCGVIYLENGQPRLAYHFTGQGV